MLVSTLVNYSFPRTVLRADASWWESVACWGLLTSLGWEILLACTGGQLGPHCTWQQLGSPTGAVPVLRLRTLLLLDDMDNRNPRPQGLPNSFLIN